MYEQEGLDGEEWGSFRGQTFRRLMQDGFNAYKLVDLFLFLVQGGVVESADLKEPIWAAALKASTGARLASPFC